MYQNAQIESLWCTNTPVMRWWLDPMSSKVTITTEAVQHSSLSVFGRTIESNQKKWCVS
jgi:hypothetical protein